MLMISTTINTTNPQSPCSNIIKEIINPETTVPPKEINNENI